MDYRLGVPVRFRLLAALAASSLVVATACSGAPPPVGPDPSPPPVPRPVAFLEDDLAAAEAKAREENKLVFVDAWAPWCHTCLSMREVVLERPELARFERSYVFVALDTDKESAAPFLERYRMRVWPTFFVLEPESGSVLVMQGGALSLDELTSLLSAGIAARDRGSATGASALARAHQAYVERDFLRAAALYDEAASLVETERRAEALLGAMRALHEAGEHERCATFGVEHASGVTGSAAPVDFIYHLRACAKELPDGEARSRALTLSRERVLALVGTPPAGASIDDRADALAIAAEITREDGDAAGAAGFEQNRLALLEEAAGRARDPVEAQVHDYERMGALLALGRARDAVALLEGRTKELPDSYEAHARLAQALLAADEPKRALLALDRAISLAYGPRRLGYLARKAEVLGKLGDRQAQVETLRAEVSGWRDLPSGHADPARLADAEARLVAAERSLAGKE